MVVVRRSLFSFLAFATMLWATCAGASSLPSCEVCSGNGEETVCTTLPSTTGANGSVVRGTSYCCPEEYECIQAEGLPGSCQFTCEPSECPVGREICWISDQAGLRCCASDESCESTAGETDVPGLSRCVKSFPTIQVVGALVLFMVAFGICGVALWRLGKWRESSSSRGRRLNDLEMEGDGLSEHPGNTLR